VVALGVLSTGIAYVLNYRLIQDEGPTAASMTNYLVPVVAVLLGVAFVDERLSWNLAVGTAVVLPGVWIAEHNPDERGAAASLASGATSTGPSTSSGRSSTLCLPAARREGGPALFERAIGTTRIAPAEVTTDQAPVYPAVLEDPLPSSWHRTDQYANNRVECDHGRLKARLGPMRGLKQDRSARVIIAGHAFVQNLRRGHYELAVDEPTNRRVAVAFDELVMAI
jgi:hypothetical protein